VHAKRHGAVAPGRTVPDSVIDLHSHVLAGIDDGPKAIEGSLELARVAIDSGIETLLATPHVSTRYPNDAQTIAGLVKLLRERLRAEGLALELRAGAEIAITRVAEIDPAELHALSLGGGPWLLIEPPFTPIASGVDAIVRDLLRRGHRVLLAHPERCPAFHRDPEMLSSLVREGVLTSLTAGSLTGQFGNEARRFAQQLLEAELAHNVASDAHDHLRRPPRIEEALRLAGGPELGAWLTHEVPAAILAGEEIPSRPAAAARPRRLPWRRR
jgi:protein-tyrosine phosphatase